MTNPQKITGTLAQVRHMCHLCHRKEWHTTWHNNTLYHGVIGVGVPVPIDGFMFHNLLKTTRTKMEDHITPDGRVFTHTATEPYTRKDGTQTNLDVWMGVCARQDCDKTFEVKTPAENTATKAFCRKHCDDHKATPSESFQRMVDTSRILSDADVAEIRALGAEGYKADVIAMLYPVKPRTVNAILRGERR